MLSNLPPGGVSPAVRFWYARAFALTPPAGATKNQHAHARPSPRRAGNDRPSRDRGLLAQGILAAGGVSSPPARARAPEHLLRRLGILCRTSARARAGVPSAIDG